MPVAKVRDRECQYCGTSFKLGDQGTKYKYCSIDCRKKYHADSWKHYKRDPVKVRRYYLKHHYGITLEDYERLLKEQNYCCAVCGTREPGGFNWHVDHCHTTGVVRGLLCSCCNQALGLIKESIGTLRKMEKYIERHRS